MRSQPISSLDTQDTEEIIETVVRIAPAFGGINLEDISAPRCFEIEERLKKLLNIPVFHDDQHGTAIVVLAGIINALKVTGKKKEDCRVVVNGAGSAGVAITKLLSNYGFPHITMCDKTGMLCKGMEGLNWMQEKMVEVTNLEHKTGTLADALKGADIFVGVSAPGIVSQEMVASMNKDSILFAKYHSAEFGPILSRGPFSSQWQTRYRRSCRIWQKLLVQES